MIKECFGVLINEPEVLIILSSLDLFLSTDLANVLLSDFTSFSLYLFLSRSLPSFLTLLFLSPHELALKKLPNHGLLPMVEGQWTEERGQRCSKFCFEIGLFGIFMRPQHTHT